MLGTRYKSYCSNVVRTLMVEPTADMQANYDLLLKVEEEILNRLQHGASTPAQTGRDLPSCILIPLFYLSLFQQPFVAYDHATH